MSRRGEMGFLKDEFDINFFRAVPLTLNLPCFASNDNTSVPSSRSYFYPQSPGHDKCDIWTTM